MYLTHPFWTTSCNAVMISLYGTNIKSATAPQAQKVAYSRYRSVLIETMALQHIDIVCIESFQTVLDRVEDVLPRQASLVGVSRSVKFCGSRGRSFTSNFAGLDWHMYFGEYDNIGSWYI